MVSSHGHYVLWDLVRPAFSSALGMVWMVNCESLAAHSNGGENSATGGQVGCCSQENYGCGEQG